MKLTAFKGNFGSLNFYVAMMSASELAPTFTPFFTSAEQALKDGSDNAYTRAQRLLDMPHVRKIMKYLSRSIRFFSSPSAACKVQATVIDSAKKLYEIEVNEPYLFDGQKRVKALILKHQEEPNFNDDLAVLFVDSDSLHVSQQLFTDTNDTQAKVSRSLSMIYNHQNPLSKFIPAITPINLLEVDKSSVSKSSTKLVTPKIMQEAIAILLNTSEAMLEQIPGDKLTMHWDAFHPYITKLFDVFEELRSVMSFSQLREQSILPHNVTFLSLVKLIPLAKQNNIGPDFLANIISLHQSGSTNRTNVAWENRCVFGGTMKKNSITIDQTAAMLGKLLNIPLSGSLAMLVEEQDETLQINMMD
jgi:DGQHR domain